MRAEEMLEKVRPREYSGIFGVKYEVFQKMLHILEVEQSHRRAGRPRKLSVTDKLVVALTYLCQYSTMRHIAFEYGIALGTVCKSVHWVVNTLAKSGHWKISLCGRENSVFIVDVTECVIERPKKEQKIYYSGKKKRHTMKIQLLINAQTQEILRMDTEKGHMHDFALYKKSHIVLDENTKLLADSGYQGIQKLHANSETPVKASRWHSLTDAEKSFNRDLGSRRIVIEHVNARLKRFGILAGRFRNSLLFFEKIAIALCNIVNMDTQNTQKVIYA